MMHVPPAQYPPQNAPYAQPYSQQPPQHVPYAAPPAYNPHAYGLAPGMQPRRNVGLIVAGSIALFIGVVVFGLFAYNAWQYATVEDRFADLEGAGWVVEMIKEAALHRMMVFGPISTVFGLTGIVLGALGLRKR